MSDVRAAILSIGDELVLGQTLDRNAAWLSERLAAIGIATLEHRTVADDVAAIAEAYSSLAERASLVVSTGGLGPTPDDLNTEAIAAAFAGELEERPEIWQAIQARISARGRPVAACNRRQAWLPRGAAVLPNPTGTAPGIIWTPDPTVLPFPVQP
ncbi:MAG: molybdopterin-binding protein, partial [Phycisphaerales bacterium]